jgi:anti-sigma B factor antagonist
MSGRTVWKLTEVASLEGERLLVVQGELDIVTAPELDAMLRRMREHDHPVVLDLEGITFMDSTGLTTLLDHWRVAQQDGWSFEVRAASRSVRRVVALAGVDRLLDGA